MRKGFRLYLQLAANDLRLRYAGSVLGVLWAFALPAVTLLIFRFVFEEGFRNGPVRSVPYLLWFASAYIPWTFFGDAISQECGCLAEYGSLVRKMDFPVGLLPAVKAGASLLVHTVLVAVLFGMALAADLSPSVSWLQLFYYEAAGFFLALGLGYFSSAVTVFFRDNISLTSLLLQAGFWATPIVWDLESVSGGPVRRVLEHNPFFYVTEGYRDSLLGGKPFWEKGGQNLYFWSLSLGLLLAGGAVFARLRPFFADEL